MEMINKDFIVFILSHGRAENVITVKTLERFGYTGKYFIIIDNEDKTADDYYRVFGEDRVIMFDKKAVASTFDEFDNFDDRRAIVYARNVCFEIAKDLGYTYFLQLDDDYTNFTFRINHNMEHPTDKFRVQQSLNQIFDAFLEYYKSIPATTIAMSQGGDWFGGGTNFGKPPKRKAMNTFFCSVNRPFKFVGRINEDVNTYTWYQSQGNLFLTIPLIQMDQLQTQSNEGGMTNIYLDRGTYIKSFYTVICSPNCTTINMMGRSNRRLHHSIDWSVAVPMIVSDKHRKL